jgi:hypothetical protein
MRRATSRPLRNPPEAGHFPDLEILARRLVQHAAGHVGADVEHQDFDRADRRFDLLDQRDDFLFLAGIAAKRQRPTACRLDLCHQGRELLRLAARHTGGIALTGKAPGDGAAGCVSCPDDQCDWGHVHSLK